MSWSGIKKQINKANIEAWCDEMGIENYTINSQCEIDVDGSVDLSDIDFKELPYKFGTITGYFNLSGNKKLTSLKNCPNKVDKWFACNNCIKLDSLEGCFKEVGGSFYCRKSKQKFTKEEVMALCKVGGEINNK